MPFSISPRAQYFFVELAAIVFGQRRDDKARIGFALGPLGLGDDAPLAAPRLLAGPVGKIIELARRPACLPVPFARRRQWDRNFIDQAYVPRQAEDVINLM